jgi:HAD superfamily hydrolase (TIGR01459 family)
MTKNLDSEGLKSIAENYDLFYIDLWGVVHNGVKLHDKAIITLKKLLELNKKFVLLTNAPRPVDTVKVILEKMGMEENLRNHVFTSGEASLSYLSKEYKSQRFYHVGPPRDFDLFRNIKDYKSNKINDCEYLLCTGLFDEHDKDLNFYKNLLESYVNKKMICTNPDLIVDKGNKRELCAGSVAMVFEKMGGEVLYFGKPYPEVYNQSIDNSNKKVLSIGDNLNTDIKGANLLNYDSLLITNGIHKNEIKNHGIEKVSKQYESIVNFMQTDLKW